MIKFCERGVWSAKANAGMLAWSTCIARRWGGVFCLPHRLPYLITCLTILMGLKKLGILIGIEGKKKEITKKIIREYCLKRLKIYHQNPAPKMYWHRSYSLPFTKCYCIRYLGYHFKFSYDNPEFEIRLNAQQPTTILTSSSLPSSSSLSHLKKNLKLSWYQWYQTFRRI